MSNNPCYPCACMLEDNLSCPEMSHCYDYHLHNDPNFERSLYTLDPLVRDMLIMRSQDYFERAERLIKKSLLENINNGPEITRLLTISKRDNLTIRRDFDIQIKRIMFDV